MADVRQVGMRGINAAVPRLADAKTKVDIGMADRRIDRVETADRAKQFRWYREHGAADQRYLPNALSHVEMRVRIGRIRMERRANEASYAGDHASVLDVAVLVQQLRSDDADAGKRQIFEQGLDPVRLYHADVVIEEYQVVALGDFRAGIAFIRKIEGFVIRHPRNLPLPGVWLQFGDDAGVRYNNDLEVGVF